ncbi:MAG: class I SAM-dependent methyltransferase [Bdellovibrionales bacterium]|nr:class I SAM-dependent methyltransferase [Bdellovibrionales bacterium]
MDSQSQIRSDVATYYAGKLAEHGATPKGVDWNSQESQYIRFDQISKVINNSSENQFSLLDYGCGFGSMFPYLKDRYKQIDYFGFDIAPKMISEAKAKNPSCPVDRWFTSEPSQTFDYVLASGIFNVKLGHSESEWKNYIRDTLRSFHSLSRRGFSFNVLTKYSDPEYMKDYLHYADPCALFDFCKREFSRSVALLHDYQLYEFTILVRKEG